MDGDKCTPEQCFVDAPEFLRWWNRFSELVLQHQNNEEYQHTLEALTNLGLKAGAITQTSIYEPSYINEAFDWKHGKIDFAPVPRAEWYSKYNPATFITQLRQVSRPG